MTESESNEAFWSLLTFIGIAVFIYQAYHFLRYGQWLSISIADTLEWAWPVRLAPPHTDWPGLWLILDYIPTSLAFLATGTIGLLANNGDL